MAYFTYIGYGRKTNRKRQHTTKAHNKDDCVVQASFEGTVVDVETVKQVFPITHFFSKVVGVSHSNDDGSSRQKLIRKCKPADTLLLRRDAGNRYSKHAITVHRSDGRQLGYLSDDLAEETTNRLSDGCVFLCFASETTGGDILHGKPTLGLNVLLVRIDDPATPAGLIQEYLDHSDTGLRINATSISSATPNHPPKSTVATVAMVRFMGLLGRTTRTILNWARSKHGTRK